MKSMELLLPKQGLVEMWYRIRRHRKTNCVACRIVYIWDLQDIPTSTIDQLCTYQNHTNLSRWNIPYDIYHQIWRHLKTWSIFELALTGNNFGKTYAFSVCTIVIEFAASQNAIESNIWLWKSHSTTTTAIQLHLNKPG